MLNKLYDVTDYLTSGKIEKIAEIAENMDPDIRNTYIPSNEETSKMDSDNFSVTLYHPRHGFINKYAMYTSGLTKLNMALLETQLEDIPDEIIKVAATKLKRAARHYKLDFPEKLAEYVIEVNNNIVDVTKIDQTSYLQKVAACKKKTPKKHALPKKKKYPIDTKEMVKKAEEYFNTYYREFDIDERIEFAKNASEQMSKLDMEPGNIITKYASLNISKYNPEIEYHIKSRKNIIHSDEMKSLYEELNEKTAEWEPIKVAKAMSKLDKENGLSHYYGTSIEDPMTAVFGIDKEAEYDIFGKIWKESDFDKISSFDGLLDDNTVSELHGEDKIDVLKSLPSPIRKKIENEVFRENSI